MAVPIRSGIFWLMVVCSLELIVLYHVLNKTDHENRRERNILLDEMRNHSSSLQQQLLVQLKNRMFVFPRFSSGKGKDANSNWQITHNRSSSIEINESCVEIHLAMICAGSSAARAVQPLIKSLLFYRRNPIHLHLVVDDLSLFILSQLLSTWAIPSLNYSFYHSDEMKPKIDWIPNLHYSGIYGLMKLVIAEHLPQDLEKVIVLDIDMCCNADIAELWAHFKSFHRENILGLVDNQSNWYLMHNSWPAKGRGFNTGVIMMDLVRLRKHNWNRLWTKIATSVLKLLKNQTQLADQDIINAVLSQHSRLCYLLPCEWNIQLNKNAMSDFCYLKKATDPKMIHWNSPLKQRANIKDSETFRRTYLAFAEYDGELLKREIFSCRRSKQPALKQDQFRRNRCHEMQEAGKTLYRTHLFFLDFDQFKSKNVSDVTLVTQLSADRILMLETMAFHWTGPISAAIYASDAEALSLVDYIMNSDGLRRRKDIGYHIVYKQFSDQALYPVNFLRNVAMDNAQTDYLFISDVDFIPKPTLREYLRQVIYERYHPDIVIDYKTAFVIPAFQTTLHRFVMPPNKQLLVIYWSRHIVTPFRYLDLILGKLDKARLITVNGEMQHIHTMRVKFETIKKF
ncbi:hypothetical protein CHUAL_002785 [Chamberlinius hualienensis]